MKHMAWVVFLVQTVLANGWGMWESMETRLIPVNSQSTLDLDFLGADLDLYPSDADQIEVQNNEFTNPRYKLMSDGGKLIFDRDDYDHKFSRTAGEPLKFLVKIPRGVSVGTIRAERVRVRGLGSQGSELLIQGRSVEIRDVSRLPERITVETPELILRDSSFGKVTLTLQAPAKVDMKNLKGTHLFVEGNVKVSLTAHHVEAALVKIAPGIFGDAPSLWSACQVETWDNRSRVKIQDEWGL